MQAFNLPIKSSIEPYFKSIILESKVYFWRKQKKVK